MKYIVIGEFGPGNEGWDSFSEWSGINGCESFYSIDGIMRSSLFNPSSKEDWENCVNEDYKLHLITNIAYAEKVRSGFHSGEIVGVIENPASYEEEIPPEHFLLGYDILDGYNNISLLTNWGGSEKGIKDLNLNKYALLTASEDAYELRDTLRKDFPGDSHSLKCEVWAVYKVE